MFSSIFPPIETALELEPEELAPFVLKHLKQLRDINRYNYTLTSDSELRNYAGGHIEEFSKRLMEAFIRLERELLVAPKPGDSGEWRFITRRGEKVLESENFLSYAKESLLSPETLDPILSRKCKSLFLRGDYDTAIFQAFKEVEIRVRKAGNFSKDDLGVDLMRKAFHPDTGPLSNKESTQAERQNMMHLFSGGIGLFKNPVSHRDVKNITPERAADIIRFANALLSMIGPD